MIWYFKLWMVLICKIYLHKRHDCGGQRHNGDGVEVWQVWEDEVDGSKHEDEVGELDVGASRAHCRALSSTTCRWSPCIWCTCSLLPLLVVVPRCKALASPRKHAALIRGTCRNACLKPSRAFPPFATECREWWSMRLPSEHCLGPCKD